MPRNGSGQYNPLTNTWNPPVTGVLATGADFQAQLTDISAAITQSVSKDGQTPMTASLPMGNNSIVGIASGTETSPSISANGDTNTGLYFPAADTVGVAVGGVNVGNFTSAGFSGNAATATNATNATNAINATNATNLVNGNATLAAGTAATPSLTTTGDTNTGLYFPAADTVAIATGGTERARIDSAGNVGIGTSSPSQRLQVAASTNQLSLTTGTNELIVRASSTEAALYTFQAIPLNFYTNNTERMRLDSSGNLGLGVTPSAWHASFKAYQVGNQSLWSTVAGNGYLTNNAFFNTSGAYVYRHDGFTTEYIQSTVNGSHSWYTAPSGTAGNAISFTQAMTLDAGGSLLVGTSAATSSTMRMEVVNSGPTGCYLANNPTFAGTNHTLFAGRAIGVDRFWVLGNGNVANQNNSYGSISDAKLKENIVDTAPKLDSLLKVRIVNYSLKTNPQFKQIGVIAQELEQIFPSMIEEMPDRDDEGNDLGTVTKSVKYSVFVPMLIKAMQEMKGIVDAQAARIAALEAK